MDSDQEEAPQQEELDADLRETARRGEAFYVLKLLEDGADPCAADAGGMTALHHACRGISKARDEGSDFWYEEMLAAFAAAGVDFNAVDAAGRRPLHCIKSCDNFAADSESFDGDSGAWAASRVVELLKQHGADLDATDGHGKTALLLALKRGDGHMAAALVKHGAAAQRNDLQREREALQQERAALEAERAALARDRAALEAAGGRAGAKAGSKRPAAATAAAATRGGAKTRKRGGKK